MLKDKRFLWFSKIPDRIKGVIGFLTAILSFILLFQGNANLTITILSILALLTLFIGCLYIAFSKTLPLIEGGKGVYRYQKFRGLALFGALLILSGAAFLIFWKPTQYFTISALTGNEYLFSEGPATFEQLLISQKGSFYQLEPTVKNSLDEDILVTKIQLAGSTTYAPGIYCCCPPTTIYEVSDQFTVTSVNTVDSVEFIGTVSEQKISEAEYQLSGEFWDNNCNTNGFVLMFDTSFTLPPNSYSSFHVRFPRSIKTNLSSGSSIVQPIQSYEQIVLAMFTNFQDEPITATMPQK